jgi:hypothetical protein
VFNRHSARIACPNGRQYHMQHPPCGEGRCGGSDRSFTKGDGVNGCGARASAKGGRPLMNRARRPIRSGACVWRRSAHYELNRSLNYGCSIERAADEPRKRSSKAIGRPGVTLTRGVRPYCLRRFFCYIFTTSAATQSPVPAPSILRHQLEYPSCACPERTTS